MKTKTDRELLELAAKAAGHLFSWQGKGKDLLLLDNGEYWNPLTDDGDALRLAVKLKITVAQHGATRLCTMEDGKYLADEVDTMGDGLAATRRAIVRAAAAIGESMP